MSTLVSARYPRQLEADQAGFFQKWTVGALAKIALYIGVCAAAATFVPPEIFQAREQAAFVGALGLIAVWRFSWWLCHFVRAKIYEHARYPTLSAKAAASWRSGWRPQQLHFLITVYKEQPETLKAVLRAICGELRATGQKASVWIGSKVPDDETFIVEYLQHVAPDLDLDLMIVRQSGSGKRNAIAEVLRAMGRHGLGRDALVAFMDSDFVVKPGILQKCLPLFATNANLHALTTDEECIVDGPGWISSWLDMRFAQRRIAMQSHALSNRVLTLTGRFSLFRGTHIVGHEFIATVESDHLTHWLWGRFTFLSGDDKSTWYALLKRGVDMLYVPDAGGYTIEVIEGSAVQRMVQNLWRWSGNMLRNGSRAIALGPRRMPPFIWWCIVDQRLAMWTMLFGPVCAILGTIAFGPLFLLAFAIYVAVTRLILSLALFSYAKRVDMNFIWCMYANQILNSAVKLYVLWRLPKQRWPNRGNQKAGFRGSGLAIRNAMAMYLTVLSLSSLIIIASLATGALIAPSNVPIGSLAAASWAK